MVTINPYLNFLGNTEEAFNFYKKVFGGEFNMISRFKDTPESGKMQPQDQNKIMHVALPIGKGNILMGTDAVDSMGHKFTVGNNIQLSVHTDNKEEADKIFNGLSEGGNVIMPMANTFWGSYFGMLADKFGVQWMVSHEQNQNQGQNQN
jgi:PhnB protein